MNKLDFIKVCEDGKEFNLLEDLVFEKPEYLVEKLIPKKVFNFFSLLSQDYYVIHTPLLIIGSNHFLNLMLSYKALNNGIDTLVYSPPLQDIWSYSLLQENRFKLIFNKSFNLGMNNNFFYNLCSNILTEIKNIDVRFGIILSNHLGLEQGIIRDKVFHLKGYNDMCGWQKEKEVINQLRPTDFYERITQDFKNAFSDYIVSTDFYNTKRKKQVCVIADKIIATSFLPHIELKENNRIYILGNSKMLKDKELLKLRDVKELSNIIFNDEINKFLG